MRFRAPAAPAAFVLIAMGVVSARGQNYSAAPANSSGQATSSSQATSATPSRSSHLVWGQRTTAANTGSSNGVARVPNGTKAPSPPSEVIATPPSKAAAGPASGYNQQIPFNERGMSYGPGQVYGSFSDDSWVTNGAGWHSMGDGYGCPPHCAGENICPCPCDCGPRWLFAVDALLFNRVGPRPGTLLQNRFDGTETFNGHDFDLGNAAGPRFDLIRRGVEEEWGVEVAYFGIHDWNASLSTRQDDPFTFGPVPSVCTCDPSRTMRFDYVSRLDSAEINLRREMCGGVAWLAGFRWLELQERFTGTQEFSSRSPRVLGQVATNNDLYGFQIGVERRVWDGGNRFHVDAHIKAGIYGNSACTHSDWWTSREGVHGETSGPAFEGEIGLLGVLQVTRTLAIRGGYQVMWLESVALAPGQITGVDLDSHTNSIDTSGGLFFHGAVVGAELAF